MSSENALKTLERRLKQSQENHKVLLEEKRLLQQKISSEEMTIQKVARDIEQLKNNDRFIVSEHAILRYFERVLKFDMEEIKKQIASQEVIEQVKQLGNGTYGHNGHRLRVNNGTVITVITRDNDAT